MTTQQKKISRELGAAILAAVKDPGATPAVLKELARRARAEGADETAQALEMRATGRRRQAATVGRAAPGADSPVPGTTAEEWERFAAALAEGRPTGAVERGRVGMYAVSVPRLADLGVVKNPRKVAGGWDAEWVASREEFLRSPSAQTAVLKKSMSDYAPRVKEKFSRAVGKEVGGKKVTLSGLLAVAHVAGERGLESWLRDGAVREKFPGTTSLFERATGIF